MAVELFLLRGHHGIELVQLARHDIALFRPVDQCINKLYGLTIRR